MPGRGAGRGELLEVSGWEVTASAACWEAPAAGRSSEEEREGLEAKSGEEGRDQRGGATRRMLPRKSDTTTLMPRGSPGCPPRARRWAPRTPGHLEVFSCIWQIAEHPARARHNKESERWPLGPWRDTEKEDREVAQF